MLEKLFLASRYFHLYKKAQGFTLILAIILTIVTTAVNASTSNGSLSTNNVSKTDSADLALATAEDQVDFSLSLSPDTLSLKPGEKGNFTLNSSNTSITNVALSISGLPTGTTAVLLPRVKFPLVVPITVGANTLSGTYTVTITGTVGNVTRKASAKLVIPDATKSVGLAVSQSAKEVFQGQTATFPIAISRTNFNDPVELGLTFLNSPTIPNLNFSFSQNPTTANNVTLSITAASNTPFGTYSFVVTGKATGVSIPNSNLITLTVNSSTAQDFTLSLSPSVLNVQPGQAATFSLNRTNLAGATGNISFTISGLPQGASSNFVNTGVFPLSVPIVTSASTPIGGYTIAITGTRGNVTRVITASLVVLNTNITKSVKLQVGQQKITIAPGQSGNYSVGINRVNFAMPVTLGLTALSSTSVPGLTFSYSQNPTSSNNVGLNITTSTLTPGGIYNFVVTGRAIGLTIEDSNIFTLEVKAPVVTQPDFSLSLSPNTLTVKPGEIANFGLSRTDVGGFSSNLSVNVSGLPNNSINGLPTSFSFPVTLPVITNSATPVGTYTITVTGIGGGLTRSASATLRVEGNTSVKTVGLQVNQTTSTIAQGQSASLPIAINRTNFIEPVELGLKTVSGSTIPGLTFGYSQNPTTANNATLNITTTNNIPTGTYNFVVTGKASGITIADSNVFTLVVNSNVQADFSLSLAPSVITVKPGETANYIITRNDVGGFSGNVVLSINGLPSGAPINLSSSSNIIALPVSTSSNTQLGAYTLTVTGVSGNITRTAAAMLVVEAAKPMIASVGYIKPVLSINGTNFTTDTRVVINGKDVSTFITSSAATLVSLKGNKKKLNLQKGANQVKVISNGIESNSVVVTAFSNEATTFTGEEAIRTNPADYHINRIPVTFDSTDDELLREIPIEQGYGVRED